MRNQGDGEEASTAQNVEKIFLLSFTKAIVLFCPKFASP